HGLYSRDVVGLRGYRVEVEGLGWRCGCHVWLLSVGGRVRPGLVVVRVVWGMRAPHPPWRLRRWEERHVGKQRACRGARSAASTRRHTRSNRDWSSDVCSSDLHGLYSRDVVGLRGYRVEVEGLGWRCGCHVWLLSVGGRVRPGLVVVRVVWGMRAPPPPWRLSCHAIR